MGKKKVHINIVVIGHVGSGKSTIVDHLIDKLGGIDIERFDKEAAEINKLSFKYGWMLDKLKAQRERGITALCMFETTKYYCTVLDATRHTDFYENNMTQADCAVLVIDSTTSGFETGLSEDDNRTLGMALHASVFGVKHMICCCNKMDATTPKYSSDTFEEIGKNFSPILMRFGYNPGLIPFVPISGIEGDNLIEPSTNIGWYNGPTLVETLDLIKPTRPSIKAMMIKDPGAAADRYLSLCRQSQRETRMLKEELKHLSSEGKNAMLDMSAKFLDSVMKKCKCISTEGENFRQDLLAKFQYAFKEELKHVSSERQNVMLDLAAKFLDSFKGECKCVSTEGENFWQDLLAKFQDAIKEEHKHVSSEGPKVMLDLAAKFLDSFKEECKCVSTEWENFKQDLLAKIQDAIKVLNWLQELNDTYLSLNEEDDRLNEMIHGAETERMENMALLNVCPKNQRKKRKIELETRTGSGYNTRSKGIPTFCSL